MWLYYYFKTKFFEWREQKAVEKRFYGHANFQSLDQELLAAYRKKSPYQISKEYLIKKKAKNPHAYGETPLTTMANIVQECALTAEDIVIEMGAGRGRAALFLTEYVGCKVLAYEQIPIFVEKMVSSSNLQMLAEDMFSADFSKASVIYLYGTMLEDWAILELTKRFPPKTKIITVSYPLTAYSDEYCLHKNFSGNFPWGKTEVYWNERIV